VRFVLPRAVAIAPERTIEVARRFGAGSGTALEGLPAPPRYPPRPIEQLLATLHAGQGQQISLMEWVLLLRDKDAWDAANPAGAVAAAREVWFFALSALPLWELLIWRLALSWTTGTSSMPTSMCRGFEAIRGEARRLDSDRWEALARLKQGPGDLAALALERGLLPSDLMGSLRLPSWGEVLEAAAEACPEVFIQRAARRRDRTGWILACLEAMDLEPMVRGVERLLLGLEPVDAGDTHPDLVEWVGHWFNPTRNPGRWSRLSPEARRRLREWTGAVHYRDFERVYELMAQDGNRERLKLNESNNDYKLRSRIRFWRSYRSQFLRLRLLLPRETYRLLASDFSAFNTQEIARLKPDETRSHYLTEVCVFEFERWIVAQEFRGGGSGLRIFIKNPVMTRALFEDSLSLMQIRAMPYEDTHDHAGGWEHRCRRFLLGKGIQPDPGAPKPRVQSLPPGHLETWNRARERHERMAKSWMQRRRR